MPMKKRMTNITPLKLGIVLAVFSVLASLVSAAVYLFALGEEFHFEIGMIFV